MNFESDRFVISRVDGLIVLTLAAVALALYFPVIGFDRLVYDDTGYVFYNDDVMAGFSLTSAWNVIFTPYLASWHPIAMLSHLVDATLYGDNPGGHHLTSMLLHAANGPVLFLAFAYLTGRRWESAVVAALFVVHPQHVEPVAWISSRKDLLSAFFFFLALLAYARQRDRSTFVRISTATVLYTFALLSKPSVVTLPFLLLLLDLWPLNRIRDAGSLRRAIGEKTPLFAVAAIGSWLTYIVQSSGGAVRDSVSAPLAWRLTETAYSYVAYLGKFVWPGGLSPFYAHSEGSLSGGTVLACLAIIAAISLVTVMRLRREPYLAVGWFWFLGVMVPVAGFVQFGSHGMADRYTYITHPGLSLALVWFISARIRKRRGAVRVSAVLAAGVLFACAAVSSSYLFKWRNDMTLWEHSVRQVPNHHFPATNYAAGLSEKGLHHEALGWLAAAEEYRPGTSGVASTRAVTLARLGRLEEALAEYRLILRVEKHPWVVNDRDTVETELANLVAMYGELLEGSVATSDCGLLAAYRLAQGDLDAAVSAYRCALDAEPDNLQWRDGLVNALLWSGKAGEAGALRLGEDYSDHYARARIAIASGDTEEAWSHWTTMSALNPSALETRHLRTRLELLESPQPHAP